MEKKINLIIILAMKLNNIMHNRWILLFLVMLMFFSISSVQAQVVDRVVAIVNDDVITSSEVNEEGKAIFRKLTDESPQAELEETLKKARKAIIEKMIDKRIIFQEAKRLNVQVSDEEAQKALSRMLKQNNISMDELKKQLAEAGVTEEQYRLNFKNQFLGNRVVSKELGSKIIIPEEAIVNYYDNNYKGRKEKNGYYILQIGLNWPSSEVNGDVEKAKSETLQKIERIRMLAVSGKDFNDLARKYSDLPSAVDGGDIGVFQKDEMAEYMQEAVSEINPGEISRIITTPTGYQFYKLLSIREESEKRDVPLESVRDEIYEILFQEKMKTEYDKWIKDLRSKAYIKIL